MARVRLGAPLVLLLVGVALAVAGCGSTSHSSHTSSTHSRTTARRQANPVPPSNTVPAHAPHPADARTVRVIKGWADALRRGDVRGAARYFHFPSFFAPAPDQEVTLHSIAEAEAVNAALPCGAKLISVVKVGGPFVQALFRLTGRPGRGGSACSPGAGQTARTNFEIKSGRIRAWIRAPDAPGENQQPPAGESQGGGPGGLGAGPAAGAPRAGPRRYATVSMPCQRSLSPARLASVDVLF
jgi:hypothetical protein